MKLKLLGILFFFLSCNAALLAQTGNVAAGVKATGSGGTVSYSVGPIIFKKPNGQSITDGLQQPYEILTLSTEEFTDASIQLSFYPNPTNSLLHLLLKNSHGEDFYYQLVALDGKQLLSPQKISSEDTTVNMESHLKGVYLLQITSGNKTVKTFKIIKH